MDNSVMSRTWLSLCVRALCAGGITYSNGVGGGLRSGRSSSLGLVKAASSVGGQPQQEEELIVLRKDDLNTILTAKPTLLIGRELVSFERRKPDDDP